MKSEDLDRKKIDFSTKNNRYAHSVENVENFNIDSLSYENEVLCLKKNFNRFYDKTIFLVDEMPVEKQEIINVDYLIIRGNPRLDLEKLFEIFSFHQVIFDNSNSQYKVRNWMKYCEDNQIDYHYTAKDGAWILTL